MSQVLSNASVVKFNGTPILDTLLMDSSSSPLISEVRCCDLAAVAIWYIWWERRKATHGETIQSSLRTAQSIMALSLNYKRIKKLGAQPIVRHGWEKPPEDFVKLNVDAAFDVNSSFW